MLNVYYLSRYRVDGRNRISFRILCTRSTVTKMEHSPIHTYPHQEFRECSPTQMYLFKADTAIIRTKSRCTHKRLEVCSETVDHGGIAFPSVSNAYHFQILTVQSRIVIEIAVSNSLKLDIEVTDIRLYTCWCIMPNVEICKAQVFQILLFAKKKSPSPPRWQK